MHMDDIIKNMPIKLGDLIVSKSGRCGVLSEIYEAEVTLVWNDETKDTIIEIENMAMMVRYDRWQIISI
jgi:preprotein translocase subunit YajC